MARPPARIRTHALAESGGSPVPPNLTVSISATLDYNGTQIPINSTIGQGLVFQLTQPVDLGTIHNFLDWLQTEFGLPNLYDKIQALEGMIPDSPHFLVDLKNAFNKFLNAEISITTLSINTNPPPSYAFGVTMTIGGTPPGLHLFGGLSLDSIGVLVSNKVPGASP
jgi:hypothetical protein